MDENEKVPIEAISQVIQTSDTILNSTKLLSQNVNDSLYALLYERQELANAEASNEDQNFLIQRRAKLSNYCNDINNKLNGWVQNMIQCKDVLATLVNVAERLVYKFSNENRLSVYFENDSNETIVPECVQPNALQKTEDYVTNTFDSLVARLIDLWRCLYDFNQQMNELVKNFVVTAQDCQQIKQSIPVVLDFIKRHLPHIISRSVLISKQPPLVILRDAVNRNSEPKNVAGSKVTAQKDQPKCQTAFDLELKIYTSNTLNRFYPPSALSVVSATMITEEDAIQVARKENPNFVPEPAGELTCSAQPFKAIPASNGRTIWTASFTNLRVRKITREKGINIENSRYCILLKFKSEQPVSTGTNFAVDLSMNLVTLPFCVIVNPSQRPKVMPPIFWSRAFSALENGYSTLKHAFHPIQWPLFKYRLNELFNIGTGANKMTEDQMSRLAVRLFGPQMNYESCPVSFEIFCKNPMPDTLSEDGKSALTFWEWFYSYMESISNKKCRPYWNDGLVLGFVSRENAEMLLKQNVNEPSMLIKFSDSTKGTLVMSFSLPAWQQEVIHLTIDDFGNRDLTLHQFFEKLCQQYVYLKNVKHIVCGYQAWERKPVEVLANVNVGDPKLRKMPNADEQQKRKKTNPYVKAEWQLCVQHPELHKFLQNVPSDSASYISSAASPAGSLSSCSYASPSPQSNMNEQWNNINSPEAPTVDSQRNSSFSSYISPSPNGIPAEMNFQQTDFSLNGQQFVGNDNFYFNTSDLDTPLVLKSFEYTPQGIANHSNVNQSMDRLEVSPGPNALFSDDYIGIDFPENMNL